MRGPLDSITNIRAMTALISRILTFTIESTAVTLSLWLGTPPVAAAQHGRRTVFGQVRRADGRPIPQGLVMVLGQQTGVVTDPDGRYVLTDLSTDKVVLQARRIGSFDKVDSVYVTPGARVELDFVLWPIPNPLDDPVIVVPQDTGPGTGRH